MHKEVQGNGPLTPRKLIFDDSPKKAMSSDGFKSALRKLERVHNSEMQHLQHTIYLLRGDTQLTTGSILELPRSNSADPICIQHRPAPEWDDIFVASLPKKAADVPPTKEIHLPVNVEGMNGSSSISHLQVEDKCNGSCEDGLQTSDGNEHSALEDPGMLAISSLACTFTEDSQKRDAAMNKQKSLDTEARRRVRQMLDDDNDSLDPRGMVAWRQKLWNLIHTLQFQLFFALVIIVNSIFLGIRMDFSIRNPNTTDPVLSVCEYMFTCLFAIELVIRLGAEGCSVYYTPKKMFWYYLDTFVLVASLVDHALEWVDFNVDANAFNLTNARTVRIVRIVRLIRVVRIARIVRFIRALRTLILSIAHTLKAVFWAFVLILVIICAFGLIFAQTVNNYVLSNTVLPPNLLQHWGTLPRSMLTLYQTITGGLNWNMCIEPLFEVHDALVALFIAYISFSTFAVLNVITGVFCEAAIESSLRDQELMIQYHLAEKKNFTKAVCELFGVTGGHEVYLSYKEFEDVLTHPKTAAYLAALQLDVADAWELFKLLDTDESAHIDVEEFVHGCLRLKGMAKAVDVAKLDYEHKTRHKRLMRQMSTIEEGLSKVLRKLARPGSGLN